MEIEPATSIRVAAQVMKRRDGFTSLRRAGYTSLISSEYFSDLQAAPGAAASECRGCAGYAPWLFLAAPGPTPKGPRLLAAPGGSWPGRATPPGFKGVLKCYDSRWTCRGLAIFLPYLKSWIFKFYKFRDFIRSSTASPTQAGAARVGARVLKHMDEGWVRAQRGGLHICTGDAHPGSGEGVYCPNVGKIKLIKCGNRLTAEPKWFREVPSHLKCFPCDSCQRNF